MSSSDTSSGSSSDANTSAILLEGLSPRHTNVAPITSTANRKRHRRGETISAFAERLFFTLFTEDVAAFLTFYGRKPGSRGLFETPVYSVILEVFNRWSKEHKSDRQKLESALKNAFKIAHGRHQRKRHRASTSQQTQDLHSTTDDSTPQNGDQQP
nr:unnamed protein product [Spirometra erinaceieuropaei]